MLVTAGTIPIPHRRRSGFARRENPPAEFADRSGGKPPPGSGTPSMPASGSERLILRMLKAVILGIGLRCHRRIHFPGGEKSIRRGHSPQSFNRRLRLCEARGEGPDFKTLRIVRPRAIREVGFRTFSLQTLSGLWRPGFPAVPAGRRGGSCSGRRKAPDPDCHALP